LISRPGTAYLCYAFLDEWEEPVMRSFLISCVAAAVIAVGAAAVLYKVQEPVDIAFTSPSGVRI
jgi:hypothetical protein